MKKYIIALIVLIVGIFAENKFTKPKDKDTIDKHTIIASRSILIMPLRSKMESRDPTKTVIINGKITVYKEPLLLSTMPDEFLLELTNSYHLPNTLRVKRDDKDIITIVSKKAKNISFIIQKSDLKKGDRVVVTLNDEENAIIIDMPVLD